MLARPEVTDLAGRLQRPLGAYAMPFAVREEDFAEILGDLLGADSVPFVIDAVNSTDANKGEPR